MSERVAAAGRVWLIGLMGCGKSTVGRALAADLSHQYVDNDVTIAELAGRSTVELADAGGNLLHEWESRYVRHVTRLPGGVVAGIPASAADRRPDLDLLTRSGLLVYLRCDLATLVARIHADALRSWIRGDAGELMADMLATRSPVLDRCAHLVVDASRPVAETVATIALRLAASVDA